MVRPADRRGHTRYLGFPPLAHLSTVRVMTVREWASAEVIRRCHAGLDASTLLEELLRRLPRVVPFDAGLLATTDPATLLYTGAVLAEQSHVSQMPAFLANEYLEDDVMKYADLATGPRRADWLSRSTR